MGAITTGLTFQSTLPRGERQSWYRMCAGADRISIHAPTRGATQIIVIRCHVIVISIHAPTRGATVIRCVQLCYIHISIHAPTRGATHVQISSLIKINISIHAPTRGATCELSISSKRNADFNPRSHEGSDANKEVTHVTQGISIHAPTRGATNLKILLETIHEFQSTLPRGERHIELKELARTIVFQSTLPRGERRTYKGVQGDMAYFNPRSHEGSDILMHPDTSVGANFNPRSHEGSDSRPASRLEASMYFNPRSHEGSDPSVLLHLFF